MRNSTAIGKTILLWAGGVIVGTLIIAASSPLFVRSYAPFRVDPVRGVWTIAETTHYRWRSEGYASTVIGPHGMPGRAAMPLDGDASLRIALWGDSQAEGCCVPDSQKIFAQIEQIASASSLSANVLPLARSGEDASLWIAQIPRVDESLSIDAHVFLIAELIDLIPACKPIALPVDDPDSPTERFVIADHVPAFVFQAIRNIFTDGETTNLRKLRFSIGTANHSAKPVTQQETNPTDWQPSIDAIRQATDRPIFLVYAPVLPSISGGSLNLQDNDSIEFERLKQVAQSSDIIVIDMRDAFLDAASRSDWPHGFHNGRFGSGHLNATGNRLIAVSVTAAIASSRLVSVPTLVEGSD
ncbi:MAG: SGNH/GDSL hydrolase family protein [Pirellulaceae bacterium]